MSEFFDLKAYLSEKKAIVDKALEVYLPEPEGPTYDLISAMRYSVFAGGKRLNQFCVLPGVRLWEKLEWMSFLSHVPLN